jgi:hypothetical protein
MILSWLGMPPIGRRDAKRDFQKTIQLISFSGSATNSGVKATTKPLPAASEDSVMADRRAFARQRVQLMRRYRQQYVALSGGRVVDHDKDDEALAARMFSKLGNAPFYLARLEEKAAVCEVPSPEAEG